MINEIKQEYVEIIKKIESSNLKVRKEDSKKLGCYFFSKGRKYNGELMVVGRAGNGCEEEYCWTQGDSAAKDFTKYVEETYMRQSNWPLKWVTDWWGRKDKDEHGNALYNSATPFWILVKEVTIGLKKLNGKELEDWPENIVWSNLYKFSPMAGGNPNYTLSNLQVEQCRNILRMELEMLRPRNILFVTGEDWFSEFGLFDNQNHYVYKDGSSAKIVVCERPEFKSPYEIAQGVLSKFIE